MTRIPATKNESTAVLQDVLPATLSRCPNAISLHSERGEEAKAVARSASPSGRS